MPAFGDITIKKADGTTNIVYTGVQRSAGDTSPARWEQQGPSTLSLRPQLAVQSSRPPGQTGALRRITINGVYPIADPTTGMEVARVTLSDAKVTISRNASATDTKEGVYQLLNLAASTVVKQCAEEGYAP